VVEVAAIPVAVVVEVEVVLTGSPVRAGHSTQHRVAPASSAFSPTPALLVAAPNTELTCVCPRSSRFLETMSRKSTIN
jgi:hypothetical protein